MGDVVKLRRRDNQQKQRDDVINVLKGALSMYKRGAFKSIALVVSRDTTIGTYWDGQEASDIMFGTEVLKERLLEAAKGDSDGD